MSASGSNVSELSVQQLAKTSSHLLADPSKERDDFGRRFLPVPQEQVPSRGVAHKAGARDVSNGLTVPGLLQDEKPGQIMSGLRSGVWERAHGLR
jgi:hypothetical protein